MFMEAHMQDDIILVAGATGYVGGRLVPVLLNRGYRVRAFTRNEGKIRSRSWGRHENLEVAQGDMLDLASLQRAVEGCSVIYYLVHSMEDQYNDFSATERRAAYNMVRALRGRTSCRVIYLSGLLPDDAHLSKHLRSRGEVEEILSLADASLTTLRAAQLIGAGSASFEMIRWLVERLPVMITPKWTHVLTQPIGISDALGYLVGVMEHPETTGESYDIGGTDVLSYAEIFKLYAEEAGLRKRVLIPVPWISLRLSAHIISVVTPIPGALAKPLIEGMRNQVICSENRIREIIPLELTPIRVAIKRALGHVRQHSVKSCWFDAGLPAVPEWVVRGDAQYAGTAIYRDAYSIRLAASPEEVWNLLVHIGGTTGWYSNNFLWRLRGFMDKMAGGPGMHRGRRSSEELYVGDGLDFWRVLDIRPNKRLLLFTEMRLPGEGLLNFIINPGAQEAEDNDTELVLGLYFRPHGLPGRAYWYAVAPFHRLVFMAMLRAMAKRLGKEVLQGPLRIKRPLKLQSLDTANISRGDAESPQPPSPAGEDKV